MFSKDAINRVFTFGNDFFSQRRYDATITALIIYLKKNLVFSNHYRWNKIINIYSLPPSRRCEKYFA